MNLMRTDTNGQGVHDSNKPSANLGFMQISKIS